MKSHRLRSPVLDPPPRFSTFTETREINLSNVLHRLPSAGNHDHAIRSMPPLSLPWTASLGLRREHNSRNYCFEKICFFTCSKLQYLSPSPPLFLFQIIETLIHGNKILLRHLEAPQIDQCIWDKPRNEELPLPWKRSTVERRTTRIMEYFYQRGYAV